MGKVVEMWVVVSIKLKWRENKANSTNKHINKR